jgi:sensor histidine kinase YesM
VVFEVENDIEIEKKLNKDKTHGIGLSNIRRRLELLYPERHDLKIETKDGKYHIHLTIDTRE